MTRFILSLCLLLALEVVANCQQNGQNDAIPADPFGGFETIRLANGLKLWYKRTPDSTDTATGIVIPFGSDRDPAGKEGLAHFTEHMLFADHRVVLSNKSSERSKTPGASTMASHFLITLSSSSTSAISTGSQRLTGSTKFCHRTPWNLRSWIASESRCFRKRTPAPASFLIGFRLCI